MKQEPLTVLVVDDELPIRQELRLVPWGELGAELVGEAENGEDALFFCRNFSPDIVITDITMPVMNGLDLFRALKRESLSPQVILLTCHSDFAYAKEAIRLGAVDYLVKVAMEQEDLERALLKAKEAIDRERSIRRSETERRRWALSRKLAQLALPNSREETVESIFREALGGMPPCLTALHADTKKENRRLVGREIEERLSGSELLQAPFRWIPAREGTYLLLIDRSAGPSSSLRARLDTLLQSLSEHLEKELSFLSDAIRLYAVVSEPIRDGIRWSELLSSVAGEQPQRFYDSTSRILYARSQSHAIPGEAEIRTMEARMRRAKHDQAGLLEWLGDELPKWALKHRLPPERLKRLLTEWRREWAPGTDEEPGQTDDVHLEEAIADASSLAELISALVHEAEKAGGKKKPRKEIAEAMRFIEENLGSSITLPVVANRVGLSPHYVSRLFREEAGVSFNDFITRKRMEKAAELLQTTTMRVYEVANAVGVPSYRYFTAMFREWMGVAPSEYKKG
ncbi:response regulator [Cohnella thailandensis]|uniref:Response regulator n=1 Tax=Cohnella thailandensis TaxID=557557 RepID=A0A841SW59_9BACL|nr:response regulator [Cohnella thailandensis]MBB6635472.1 response regulator [Cohnella thailandensis]MBP1974852.1 two-component system response regulator YesN [Cohnella thailandensis]